MKKWHKIALMATMFAVFAFPQKANMETTKSIQRYANNMAVFHKIVVLL